MKTEEIKEQFVEENSEGEMDSSKQPVLTIQWSMSDEAANSLVSVGVQDKISVFYYCGENSSLGQGNLRQFRVTSGLNFSWNDQPCNKAINDNSSGTCEKIQNSVHKSKEEKEKNPSRM